MFLSSSAPAEKLLVTSKQVALGGIVLKETTAVVANLAASPKFPEAPQLIVVRSVPQASEPVLEQVPIGTLPSTAFWSIVARSIAPAQTLPARTIALLSVLEAFTPLVLTRAARLEFADTPHDSGETIMGLIGRVLCGPAPATALVEPPSGLFGLVGGVRKLINVGATKGNGAITVGGAFGAPTGLEQGAKVITVGGALKGNAVNIPIPHAAPTGTNNAAGRILAAVTHALGPEVLSDLAPTSSNCINGLLVAHSAEARNELVIVGQTSFRTTFMRDTLLPMPPQGVRLIATFVEKPETIATEVKLLLGLPFVSATAAPREFSATDGTGADTTPFAPEAVALFKRHVDEANGWDAATSQFEVLIKCLTEAEQKLLTSAK